MGGPTGQRLAARDVRIGVVVGVIVAVLGSTWALTTPLYAVPDEAEHLKRVATIASGVLVGGREEATFDDGSSVTRFVAVIPRHWATTGDGHRCFAFSVGTADCIPPLLADPVPVPASTTAGAYPPLPYAMLAPALSAGQPAQGYLAARLASAALCAVLAGAAAAHLSAIAGALGVAAVLLAMTPMALSLAGSVNPNGLEITSALATWVGVSAVLRRPGRAAAVMTVVAAFAFAWSRPLSPVLLVCTVAACTLALGPRRVVAEVRSSGLLQAVAAALAAAVASSVAWLLAFDTLDSFIAFPQPDLVGATAARASIALLPSRLEQMVGVLGWVDVRLPPEATIAYAVAVVAVIGLGLSAGTGRGRLALLGVTLAAVAMPVLAEVRSASQLGLFWHGRYTLPVAVGALVLAAVVTADGLAAADPADRVRRRGSAEGRAVLAVLVAGTAAACHVCAHLYAMSRYSTGLVPPTLELAAHPWSYLAQPGWSPPGPDGVHLALVAAAALAMPAVVAVRGGLGGTAAAGAAQAEVVGR